MISMDAEEDEKSLDLPDADAPNPESEMMHSEQREQIQGLLKRLDGTDRAAIIMRYWNDCSESEIAEALQLTVSAVKSRLHRARRELAGLWQEDHPRPKPERRPHESPAF
jgi:RNA polymerase sigma-70 factor (ECF subfamily)